MFAGDQADTALLSRIAAEVAPEGFDLIIDDCSHIGALTKTSFWHLFDRHLKPGAIYVIEDWATGYWDWWPDGRIPVAEPDAALRMPNHDAGMVGFIKQLIDELPTKPDPESRRSRLASVAAYASMCVVRKAL